MPLLNFLICKDCEVRTRVCVHCKSKRIREWSSRDVHAQFDNYDPDRSYGPGMRGWKCSKCGYTEVDSAGGIGASGWGWVDI